MEFRRVHRGFTPEAITDIRYRYEQTDEPLAMIAADFGVHRKTLDTLAKTSGWNLRKDRGPRDLPPDLRLATEATNAVRSEVEGAGNDKSLTVADRLERQLEQQLAAVETMRAVLGAEPLMPADAERTTRILERLTDALFKVRRLRSPEATGADPATLIDMPQDIDEFRHALARRIEAFVRSRSDATVPVAGGTPGTDTA
jgi:hypothetical protein